MAKIASTKNMKKRKNAQALNHDLSHTVYGIHAVESLLTHSPDKIQALLLSHHRTHDAKFKNIIKLAQDNNIIIEKLTHPPEHSQGIMASCYENTLNLDLPSLLLNLDTLKKPALLLILDGVQDPHNLGACLRSANAAGVDAVIIPKDRAVSLTATVKKIASGAAEITPLISVTNLSRTLVWLKEQGVWLYGMAGDGQKSLYDNTMNYTFPTAFVLGSEGEGLRRLTREHCDEILSIPMANLSGTVSSLNVSVATGICLFEAVRQRRK